MEYKDYELLIRDLIDKKNNAIDEKEKEIIKLINKKPILATQSELVENKRSQSAKLRIIEKGE